MKYLLFGIFALAVVLFSGCSNPEVKDESSGKDSAAVNTDVAKIQVIYFHGTRRCPSCIAIGDESARLIQSDYKQYVDAGDVSFKDLNIDEEPNYAIAEKYQVAGSALLVIKTVDGKEEITDLTGDGFKFAMNMPDMFRSKLKTAIDNYLN